MEQLEHLLDELELPGCPDAWRTHWEAAQATIPERIPFLEDRTLCAAAGVLALDKEKLGLLMSASRMVRTSRLLRELAWLWYTVLADNTEAGSLWSAMEGWEAPPAMGEGGDLLHGLVLVGLLPHTQSLYQQLDIPDEVMADTLEDFSRAMDEYRLMFGHYGIGAWRGAWLLHHFHARLFRLGRLQFMPEAFESHPDVPLEKGAALLDVHIPAGESMDHDACEESYRRAVAFFPRHFPGKAVRGFTCQSWLLSPALVEMLDPASNILRFQRDYTVYRVEAGEDSIYENVFHCMPCPPEILPADTRLRRAVKAALCEKRPIGEGVGVILQGHGL